jgi:hypothetical protein
MGTCTFPAFRRWNSAKPRAYICAKEALALDVKLDPHSVANKARIGHMASAATGGDRRFRLDLQWSGLAFVTGCRGAR